MNRENWVCNNGSLWRARKFVLGYRYIWLLCEKPPPAYILATMPDVKWLNESLIGAHVPLFGQLRANMTNQKRTELKLWYEPKKFGMAVKLYVQVGFPEVSDNLFHMDSDVFWLREWDPWTDKDEQTCGKQKENACPKYVLSRTNDIRRNGVSCLPAHAPPFWLQC